MPCGGSFLLLNDSLFGLKPVSFRQVGVFMVLWFGGFTPYRALAHSLGIPPAVFRRGHLGGALLPVPRGQWEGGGGEAAAEALRGPLGLGRLGGEGRGRQVGGGWWEGGSLPAFAILVFMRKGVLHIRGPAARFPLLLHGGGGGGGNLRKCQRKAWR